MRKSFDGLLGLLGLALHDHSLSRGMFVFTNRRRTLVKAVCWDGTDFCLFAKRFARGRFVLPGEAETFELNERAFHLLLDGIALGARVRLLQQ